MQKSHIFKDLTDFIKIESVSTDKKRFPQMLKAVSFLQNKLRDLGFKVELLKKESNPPLILAYKNTSTKAKTIAIYGHYDVQPEDPLDKWQTLPFQLTQKNGKFYGRGVADNKGSIIQNLAVVSDLIEKNQLKNNLVFILEGEEETASAGFEEYVKQAKNVLKDADVFFLTDVGMHEKNKPQIFYSLRGILYFELEVIIGARDLHSGVYGNRVLNPIQVVASLLAKIKDVKTGRILIPGFYDQVRKIDRGELELLKAIHRTDEEEMQETQTYTVTSLNKKYPYLSTKIYPSFDAHGIIGGFTTPGIKTVIPCTASVKFSFRLVEYQDADDVEALIRRFIKNNLSDGVKYKLYIHDKSAPFYTEINNEYVEKTCKVLESEFKNKVLLNRAGGSIPAAEILQRLYKKPIVLTGFTLPDDNIHAPNENFDEEMFWKGIETLKKIYSQ